MNPIDKPRYVVIRAPLHYKTVKQFEKWIKYQLNKVKNSTCHDFRSK